MAILAKIVRYIALVSAMMGIMVIATGGAVQAQTSQLFQEILPPACLEPSDCIMTAPSIQSIWQNNGRPIFSGSYDPAFSKSLRVIFHERTYVLGVNSGLSAIGGTWTLDLSSLSPQLTSGQYTLVVESESFLGELKRDMREVAFLVYIDPPDPISSETELQDGDLATTGQRVMFMIVIAATFLLFSIFLFLVIVYTRRLSGYQPRASEKKGDRPTELRPRQSGYDKLDS